MIPTMISYARLTVLRRALLCLSLLACYMLAACLPAQAQVGVGFVNAGWYEGTIGSNKGAVAGYMCPNGGVLRGIYHVDKKVPASPSPYSASGMTAQVGLYCSLVIMTKDKVPRVYKTTPDGTPSIMGAGYANMGAVNSGYCPTNQIATRMGGDFRNSTGWPWASNLSFVCRPLTIIPGDWVAINILPNPFYTKVGNMENNLWRHSFSGWFCSNTDNTVAVDGIYRQAGGEGWDGINIYCAHISQARISARISFDHFDWNQALWDGTADNTGTWKTDLTKNGQVLEVTVIDPDTNENVLISGRNKLPYSSRKGDVDNDPNVFQDDYEIFVLPGSGYGANLSQKPSGIPEAAYTATSTCKSTLSLKDHEDSTCDLYVIGRPDLRVAIDTLMDPDQNGKPLPFIDAGDTQLVSLRVDNYNGATAARAAAGFTLEVDIPAGWTPAPDAAGKCKVSGQHVSCAIDQDLASGPDPSDQNNPPDNSGSMNFQFPITANSSAQPGTYPVPVKLGRAGPDADGNIYDSDYNTDNDTDSSPIRFVKKPRLSITKTTLDGTDSFTFSGDNGWQDQVITTDAANAPKAGDTQILAAPATTTITETLPKSDNPAHQWVMLGADKGTGCAGLGGDPTNNPPTPGTATIDTAAGSVSFDMLATDYNTNISCNIVNQLITTRTRKSSDLGNNTPVQSGDTITYTITTQVVGAATAKDTVITDTLDDNLDYSSIQITSQGDFTNIDNSAAPVMKLTLPAGSAIGPHSISYTVKVAAHAKSAVINAAASDNGYCDACSTQNPLVQIATVKKSDVGNGNPIGTGQLITYTLTTTITGGPSTNPVVLSDFISGDLDFVAVQNAGAFKADTSKTNNPSFTLPAGTKPGSYDVVYTARVKPSIEGDTAGAISNKVSADHGSCDQCETNNPVVSVNVSKTSDIGDGKQLQNGDLVTYTLHVSVKGSGTLAPTVLTDTLSSGLTFRRVADTGSFKADTSAAPVLAFTLPQGTPAGDYAVSYTAQVNQDAKGNVSNNVVPKNAVCDNCATSNPLTNITADKQASPAGTARQRGDIITYTATLHVKDGATTAPITLTDTLGTGLDFAGISNAGSFTADTSAAPMLKFTLPAGSQPGDYPIIYQGKVNAQAGANVANNLATSAGTCANCATANPVVKIDTVKTSNIPASQGAQPGDTITYTLTTTIASGPTTADTVLSDWLGESQTLGAIDPKTSAAFTANTKVKPFTATLKAGTKPGAYKFIYTATVNKDATADGMTNKVASSAGTDCSSCQTNIPLVNIVSSKSVNVGANTPVQPGDVLTYALTTVISGSATTKDLVLTDKLNPSLSFIGIVGQTDFKPNTANPAAMSFTLPKGTQPGTYTVTYQARVGANATASADNSLTPNNGACIACATSNPIVQIATVKTSDAGDGTAVQRGDTITYTLTTTITGGPTTQDTVLTDTLGPNLSYNHIVSADDAFNADADNAPALKFTLPKGTPPGTYKISYTADVNGDAKAAAQNNVVADHGACSPCATTNPLVEVSTVKTSNIGDGTAVQRGDIITYSLTANVSGGATTQAITLTDTLDDNLQYISADKDSGFTVDASGAPVLQFTLPAGAAAGPHKISYQARVRESAGAFVQNKVQSSYDKCDTCATKNPTVNYKTTKSAATASGSGSAQIGDTITYTLTTVVSGGKTTKDLVVVDNPGPGLTYNPGSDSGDFNTPADASDPKAVKFTLPKGTPPGTYTATYTATVNGDAKGAVRNVIVPSDGTVDNNTTITPLSGTMLVKSVSPAAGTYVQRGDSLTYTISISISGAASTQNIYISDTLGAGLSFGQIIDAGAFTNAQGTAGAIKAILPAGKAPGTYKLVYTAIVGKDAQGNVGNNAAITDSDGNNPAPCISGSCSTQNPITDIKISKTASPAAAQPGDTITYTANVQVIGGPTTRAVKLTDTLGKGLNFGRLVSAGRFAADTSAAPVLSFTLPAGTAQGTYSVKYTAIAAADATGQLANALTSDDGVCDGDKCAVITPITAIDTVKTANPAAGSSVAKGDIITYTITSTVKNGATTKPLIVSDTLGPGLKLVSGSVNQDKFSSYKLPTPFAPNTLSFTLNSGAAAGTYTATYQAQVQDDAGATVANQVSANNGSCSSCAVQNPLAAIIVNKSVKNTSAEPGDLVEYTLTATISGGKSAAPLVLSDVLDPQSRFEGMIGKTDFTLSINDPKNPQFTLAAGTAAGTYSVTYKALVAPDAKGALQNKVTANGGQCNNCATSTPIVSYSAAKTSDAPAGGVMAGDTITYTITATISGGASTRDYTLTDTIGDGLTYGDIVGSADPFSVNTDSGSAPVFTLPKGTPAGTYKITYTATVNNDAAAGSLTNSLKPGRGACDNCATSSPLVSVSASKKTLSGNVQPGDTVSYQLTVNVKGGATSQDTQLADTLGAGLTYTGITDNNGGNGDFVDNSKGTQNLAFTLPKGAAEGTYTLTYTAALAKNATADAHNSLTLNNAPAPCDDCSTNNPLVKISSSKTVSPAGAAQKGDILTYTLTVHVENGPTTQATSLTDHLGAGLSFVAITAPGGFTANINNKQQPRFTLKAGAENGDHKISYTVKIGNNADKSVKNSVSVNNGSCDNCNTETPLLQVSTIKTANPSGPVQQGDTITYTLTATLKGGASTQDIILTDTLGKDLTYGSVSDNSGKFSDPQVKGQTLSFTLPKGSPEGSHSVSYTATVGAGTDISNNVVPSYGDCPSCSTSNPVARVSLAKSVSPQGAALQGDTLTYTITAHVENGPTSRDTVMTDTLGDGLSYSGVSAKGDFNDPAQDSQNKQQLTFTLPKGAPSGDHSISYTAKITDISKNVQNNLVPVSGGSCPDADKCKTATPPVIITTTKSVSPAGSALAGDTLTYTLTTKIDGGPATQAVVLTDTLGDGLKFAAVKDAGIYNADTSQAPVLTFTLPAGTAPGTYSTSYTAIAGGNGDTLHNSVIAQTTDGHNPPTNLPEPSCPTCDTKTPLTQITTEKTANPAPGDSVNAGDMITYTLSATVKNGPTNRPITLTDAMGSGLEYQQGSENLGQFNAPQINGQNISFTLPAGKTDGTYSVSYQAKVSADAPNAVHNMVSPDAGSCTKCDVSNPVSRVVMAKSSDKGARGVMAGDTITYTITATVSGGPTAKDTILTDTLGAGLTFDKVQNAGGFTVSNTGQTTTFTLPKGTAIGAYTATYTAKVSTDAAKNVSNNLTSDSAACADAASCATQNPIVKVNAVKKVVSYLRTDKDGKQSSGSLADGNAVYKGDTITYEVDISVLGGATNKAITIPDNLADSLQNPTPIGGTQQAWANVSGGKIAFTIPEGTPANDNGGRTYSIIYTASIPANAPDDADDADNTLQPGDDASCSPCATHNPLSGVKTVKTVSPAGPVQPGDTLTYTLTTTVSGAPLPDGVDFQLSDVLSSGLKFGAVGATKGFIADTASSPLKFTLPKGSDVGTYSVSYTATVEPDAKLQVGNKVTATYGGCKNCATVNPLVQISTAKTSAMAGKAVQVGAEIPYTLTTTITNGPTTQATVLSDNLGSNLQFGAVSSAGAFSTNIANAAKPQFTLPAGTPSGTYSISYTAKVISLGDGDVTNSVSADHGDCADCAVKNPPVSIKTVKTADPADGQPVQVGDIITYTLTTNASGQTSRDINLTDTLNSSMQFVKVLDGSDFTADTSAAPALKFTLKTPAAAGDHKVSYQARVLKDAAGDPRNSVISDQGACSQCQTHNPLATISVAKTANPPAGQAVQQGDEITYTLTATVKGGAATQNTVLKDALGNGLELVEGSAQADKTFTINSDGSFTLPIGTPAGTYSATYKAKVLESAAGSVENAVSATPTDKNNNPIPGGNIPCDPCKVNNPVASVSVAKSVKPEGAVQKGDILTYTLTATVAGGASSQNILLKDSLGQGLELVPNSAVLGNFKQNADGSFTLPAGQPEGAYTVSYKAKVLASAKDQVQNQVSAAPVDKNNNPIPGGKTPCDPCSVKNPLATVSVAKTANPAAGTAVQAGDEITYTLTATVAGGAATQNTVLSDNLGNGLELVDGSVKADSPFTANDDGSFTLPIGAPEGTYSVSYKAKVLDSAVSGVDNAVSATPTDSSNTPIPGGDVPCQPCTVHNPLAGISVAKSVSPADGTAVQAGDTLTYTLTATVSGGTSSRPALLTDTLGDGLTFGQVVDKGDFTADTSNPQTPKFTLPAGKAIGTYSVSYTAIVGKNAKLAANKVAAVPANPDGTPNTDLPPLPCDPCQTHNPLATVSVAKTANPPAGHAVQTGDEITYTLTATVKGGAATQNTVLKDALGAGLTLDKSSVVLGDFKQNDDGSYILPIGKPAGTYQVSYKAIVGADAKTSVANAVSAAPTDKDNNPIPGGAVPCDPCTVNNPVATISTVKSVSPADGTAVQAGDTLTYTLTATVSGGTSSRPVLLTDTLGDGLTFGSVVDKGAFTADTSNSQQPKFTLPAGKASGTYSVSYTAIVGKNAKLAANKVAAVPANPDGTPNTDLPPLPCDPCRTHNPIATVSVAKTANPPAGSAVQAGDEITYTLTASVKGGTSTQNITLDDALGAGLTLDKNSIVPGAFTQNDDGSFTLPAGKTEGDYSLSYKAIVGADAKASVENAVSATPTDKDNNPIPGGDVPCDPCKVNNPIAATTTEKSAVPPAGSAVQPGDIITYTLTVHADGKTSQAVLLTDTLSDSLSFDKVSSQGKFNIVDTKDPAALKFALPAGQDKGDYSISYTAKVKAGATVSADNNVVPQAANKDNTPIDGLPPLPCPNCATQHPIAAVAVAKTASPKAGTAVAKGDTITYTLTATVKGGATTQPLLLTDSLNNSLTFGAVADKGAFTPDTSNPQALKFTLPAGAPAGTYQVSYTAKVNQDAKSAAQNNVVPQALDPQTNQPIPDTDTGKIPCDPCSVNNPLIGISAAKSSVPAAGVAVQPGDTITYTLTADVEGGGATQATLLTDSLGDSLTFGAVVNQGDFTADTGNPKQPKFVLPAGAAIGKHSISYTAIVKKQATVAAQNNVAAVPADPNTHEPIPNLPPLDCKPCAVNNPLTQLNVAKSAVPAAGTAVSRGDTITYTLSVKVSNGATTQPLLLTDSLSDSLQFGDFIDKGVFTAAKNDGQTITATLPAGSAANTYTISYTAIVKKDAKAMAQNKVVPAVLDKDGNPDHDIPVPCDSCSVNNPLIGISAAKTSSPANGAAVQTGDLITYTLTANVKGGKATQPTLLTDTLNDSLEFAGFGDKGDFTAANSGQTITALLPSGAAEGAHIITYTARVKKDATLTAANSVIAVPADKDGNPSKDPNAPIIPCEPCKVENPLAAVSVVKTSQPGSGASVQTGDEITYKLTATVKGGALSQNVNLSQNILLTDTMGNGLTLEKNSVNLGSFKQGANEGSYILPSGTPAGSYDVSYKAKVGQNAQIAVNNKVAASPLDPKTNQPIPDAGEIPCEPCSTQNPLATVAAKKEAVPANGSAVQPGDIITYTITAEVSGAPSAADTVLTDTLNDSLEFISVSDKGDFTADSSAAPKLSFVLPAGSAVGAHTATYTARVKKAATLDAQNGLTAQARDKNGNIDPNITIPCDPCQVKNPLASVSVAKSSDVGDKKPVQQGDIITYMLKATVKGGASTQAALLTDTLNPSLQFIKFTDNSGGFTTANNGNSLTALLPAGKMPGDYTISYQAQVKKDATFDAANSVVAQPADKDGNPSKDPNAPSIPCQPCATSNPLVMIAAAKALDVGTGSAVSRGDILTYTLDASIIGGSSTQNTLLTDTLGPDLEFVGFTDKGDFNPATNSGNTITALLPKGAAAGDHKISYQARVLTNAKTAAQNSVKAQPADKDGKPSNDPNAPAITCAPCATQNPLVNISTAKTSDVGDSNPVQAGQTITYRLTTTINGGALTQPLTLSDTLSDNLQFVAVSDAGKFTANSSGSPLQFTLPKGTPAGSYSIAYQVKVKDDARIGKAQNNVAANQGDCSPCSTQNPIIGIATTKTSDVGDGKAVQPGDTITYTLTTIVSGGNSTKATNLTDTLDPNLQFGAVADKGAFSADTGNPQQPKFTLPAGTAPGTYKISYTAIVKNTAANAQAVKNNVSADNGSCAPCSTQNPLVSVAASKASDIGDGKAVQTGNIITYTATVEVKGGATTQATLLSDTLNDSLKFIKISDAGKFSADTAAAPLLKFTLPAGAPEGSYKISYQAQVKANATADAQNSLTALPLDKDGNPSKDPNAPKIPCQPCSTHNPITQISAAKSSDVGDGTYVQAGDLITYTLTVKVEGGETPQPTLLTDTLNDSLEFAGFKDKGKFTAQDSGKGMKAVLPAGAPAGTYAITYQARVIKTATADAKNSVVAQPADKDGNPDTSPNAPTVPCEPCALTNPLTSISASKISDIGDNSPTQSSNIITYKMTVLVKGGATSRNMLFTDTMNSNLSFIGATDCKQAFPAKAETAAPFLRALRLKNEPAAGAKSFSAALPAGTQPGSYDYCYQARVIGDVGATAQNTITPAYANKQNQPINDPDAPQIPCAPCSTQNPISGVKISKSVDPENGKAVVPGETLTYTITINAVGGPTTQAIQLTDTLNPNLQFIGTVNANDSSSPITYNADGKSAGQVLTFTAYPGLQEGPHTVSYQAKVRDNAAGKVANSVVARGQQSDKNGNLIPDTQTPPLPCEPCQTQNPLSAVSAVKSANISNNAPVAAGQTLIYTLSVNVSGGNTPYATALSDTLNDNLIYIGVKDKGKFTVQDSAAPVKFILPANTPAGSYAVSYIVKVKDNAAGLAQNSAVPAPTDDNGNPPKDKNGNPVPADSLPKIPCEPCSVQNPISGAQAAKTSDVGDKTPVHKGQVITYILTAKIVGADAPYATLLTDSLNPNLTYIGVKDKGAFTVSDSGAPQLKFILPAGAKPGEYSISYQAKVKEDAEGNAQNSVVAQPSNNDGTTPPIGKDGKPVPADQLPKVPCQPCATQNPIAGVQASKASDVGDGAAVHQGQEITYTLTVNVAGGAADLATKLTDTLNDSLEFESFTDKGKFTAANSGNAITAILPAGSAPGTYSISYKAKVKTDASADAQNSVIAAPSDNDGNPPKDKNGNIIPPNELPKVPCRPCATTNPLQSISVSKTSDKPDAGGKVNPGASVQAGDIITYTLDVSVSGNGATAQAVALTDTLNDSLEFVGVKNAGPFKTDTSAAPQLKFILPSGAPGNADYTVSYQARVKANATLDAANSVKAQPSDNNGNPPKDKNGNPIPPEQLPNIACDNCATSNPLTGISVMKEANPAPGTAVKRGDIITYRLTANINGAATVRNIMLTDTMNASLQPIGQVQCGDKFAAAPEAKALQAAPAAAQGNAAAPASSGGANGGGAVSGQSFSVSVPAGTQAGTYTYCYTARVMLDATANARNNVVPSYVDGEDKPISDPNLPAIPCPVCSVEHPLSEAAVTKASDIGDGKHTKAGAEIVYTLTATITGGAADQAVLLTDTLGPNLDFVNVVNAGKFKADTAAAPKLKFILPAGTEPGAYEVSYRVKVKEGAVGKADNSVVPSWSDNDGNLPRDPDGNPIAPENQPKIPCKPCLTSNPLEAEPQNVAITKSVGIRAIRRGEQAPYTIRITNNGANAINGVRVVDTAPSGFRFVGKSASVDGKAAEPQLAGRNVIFTDLALAPKQTIELHLNMLALSSATPGEYTNRAHAEDANGNRLTDDAKATVEILVEHVFDCADVIGTVFDDANRNGYQDDGEQGLGGVRLATAKGWIITTDAYGRYHIPCAALPDSRIGSNFIVKLDPRSLPSGYRLTTENPRVVRLTAGKLTKINFGASISRVVRLDLRGDAFEPKQTALKPQWRAGINTLIEALDKEQSVLRLSYSEAQADKKLALARVNEVEQLIRKIWSSKTGRYRLEIESRAIVGGK